VHTGAQIGCDAGVKGVGVALALEALDAAFAAMVGIGGDPRLAP